jgi:hypothetical protein
LYLCYAFEIPYATFKRWKADALVSKKFVTEHKGKSVLTDQKWASQVFNEKNVRPAWNGGVVKKINAPKNMTRRKRRFSVTICLDPNLKV